MMDNNIDRRGVPTADDPPLRFAAASDSVHVARRSAHDFAVSAGAAPDRASDLALVVSELVENAVQAASSDQIEVRFGLTGTTMRVEVDDDGPGAPHLITGSEHGGFGLQIVARLTSEWGVEQRSRGKTVWAELALNPTDQRLRPI